MIGLSIIIIVSGITISIVILSFIATIIKENKEDKKWCGSNKKE